MAAVYFNFRELQMRYTVSFIILFSYLTVQAGDETPLIEKMVLDDKVTLLLPKNFKPLSEKLLLLKYPSSRRPTLVYSNARANVNVTFMHSKTRMAAGQIRKRHKVLEAGFKIFYPSAKWFRSEVKKINGREFILMEYRTPAIDTEIRNIMLATSLDDRLLIISFNTVKRLEGTWMPIGNKIVESVKIVK